ncbi:AraC family transcriptional regulator [Falsiroseomonas sp. HW251]|uniref:AraC family transcriptional regulator n=1 Tax=Falsiroseomonas sp. HW251 TaxID=3390998 RepID=UPI003D31B6FD
MPKVIDDVRFRNEVEVISTPARSAARSAGCHRTSAWLATRVVRAMFPGARLIDPPAAAKFKTVSSIDPAEFTASSRISSRLPGTSHQYGYQLRDRALWRMRFNEPIFAMASRSAGTIEACFAENRFSTDVRLSGDESGNFVVVMPCKGALTLLQDGAATTASEGGGLVMRPSPRAQVVFSDSGGRANLCFKVAEVEETLRHTLDRDLRRPLEFAPALDWTCGLAVSFKRQLDAVFAEFQSLDGVVDNPVALAAMTDLLVTLLLRAARHNYADQLDVGAPCAVPAYVRRAEEFMRANSTRPIRIAEVAVAAGCSVRNLHGVFRRFRGTTPLAALQACRLEQVHAELSRGGTGGPIGAVARRYGFTNASRFGAAFRRRFGEAPSDVVRRASRS